MFQAGSCLTLGSLYSAKVIDTKDTGVDVVVDCEGKTVSCLIPTPHLTDHASLTSILLASVQTGNSLQAFCFQQDVYPILTMTSGFLRQPRHRLLDTRRIPSRRPATSQAQLWTTTQAQPWHREAWGGPATGKPVQTEHLSMRYVTVFQGLV